jgi:hypothetical protein
LMSEPASQDVLPEAGNGMQQPHQQPQGCPKSTQTPRDPPLAGRVSRAFSGKPAEGVSHFHFWLLSLTSVSVEGDVHRRTACPLNSSCIAGHPGTTPGRVRAHRHALAGRSPPPNVATAMSQGRASESAGRTSMAQSRVTLPCCGGSSLSSIVSSILIVKA